ncbi:MAG: hypothetical protein ACXVJT_02815 [Thermoanaerobaculia bacterium]
MSIRSIITFVALALLTASAGFGQTPPKSALAPAEAAALKKVVTTIESWGKDPILIREVIAQNAARQSAAEIAAIDKAWMAGGENELVARLLSNACATRLKALTSTNPAFSESFVMDNQGANVCMTDRTSDYWQGDEAKWQKSFNGGKGATFVDQARYDVSSKAILVQVSVPVTDGGTVIGAITVGVSPKLLTGK